MMVYMHAPAMYFRMQTNAHWPSSLDFIGQHESFLHMNLWHDGQHNAIAAETTWNAAIFYMIMAQYLSMIWRWRSYLWIKVITCQMSRMFSYPLKKIFKFETSIQTTSDIQQNIARDLIDLGKYLQFFAAPLPLRGIVLCMLVDRTYTWTMCCSIHVQLWNDNHHLKKYTKIYLNSHYSDKPDSIEMTMAQGKPLWVAVDFMECLVHALLIVYAPH